MGKSGRNKFRTIKPVLIITSRIFGALPHCILQLFWDWSSRYTQFFFVGIRYAILKSMLHSCGDNVYIGANVRIKNWHNISIGSNVSIHDNCYIDGAGSVEILNNVSIAHNTSILSSNHSWLDNSVPIKYNPVMLKPVKIKEDVWIASGVKILAGVIIHSRSVVAAGSVVTRLVPSNVIVGGIPAKIIKRI